MRDKRFMEVSIGRGIEENGVMKDTLNVFGVRGSCKKGCPLAGVRGGKFRCVRHNGNSVVIVEQGMTRDTVAEFLAVALCGH